MPDDTIDNAFCTDKKCKKHEWRMAHFEDDSHENEHHIIVTFYCIFCLCYAFTNFCNHDPEEHTVVN